MAGELIFIIEDNEKNRKLARRQGGRRNLGCAFKFRLWKRGNTL
jgi:hypothetical protein